MMRNSVFIKRRLPLLILFIAFSLFMLSMVGNSSENETVEIARKASARLHKRLARLETFAMEATSGDAEGCLEGLPDDMVI